MQKPQYRILNSPGSLIDLEKMINMAAVEGWETEGGPFHNHDSREWCQLMARPFPQKVGDVRLKEPKR